MIADLLPCPKYKETDLPCFGQVPLLDGDGTEVLLRREVSPIPRRLDKGGTIKVSCEISFVRHFYKPRPLCSLEEIQTDILTLEQKTGGVLADIIGTTGLSQ